MRLATVENTKYGTKVYSLYQKTGDSIRMEDVWELKVGEKAEVVPLVCYDATVIAFYDERGKMQARWVVDRIGDFSEEG